MSLDEYKIITKDADDASKCLCVFVFLISGFVWLSLYWFVGVVFRVSPDFDAFLYIACLLFAFIVCVSFYMRRLR